MPIKLILNDPKQVKPLKEYLNDRKALLKKHKIERHNDEFHIYTTITEITPDLANYKYEIYEEDIQSTITLYSIISQFFTAKHVQPPPESSIPKRWSMYPPMILFNQNTFDSPTWQAIFQNSSISSTDLFKYILTHQQQLFGTTDITHVAINKPITDCDNTNIMRKPLNILPLFGDFGPLIESPTPTPQDFDNAFWCHVVQNGIYQTWAPRYTMFSRGNIKEKKRILDNYKHLQGSVVVDLYCGIGYFSLSYLRNGAKLMCWELNPWSIEGFRRSLEVGGYTYRIIHHDEAFDYAVYTRYQDEIDVFIFLESNEYVPMRLKTFPDSSLSISHVNMGLLPSSKASWGIAHQLVKEKSSIDAIVHIHENVHVDQFEEIKQEARGVFVKGEIVHLERVKTFAPDVWHIVIDVYIKKQ